MEFHHLQAVRDLPPSCQQQSTTKCKLVSMTSSLQYFNRPCLALQAKPPSSSHPGSASLPKPGMVERFTVTDDLMVCQTESKRLSSALRLALSLTASAKNCASGDGLGVGHGNKPQMRPSKTNQGSGFGDNRPVLPHAILRTGDSSQHGSDKC